MTVFIIFGAVNEDVDVQNDSGDDHRYLYTMYMCVCVYNLKCTCTLFRYDTIVQCIIVRNTVTTDILAKANLQKKKLSY